VVVILYKELLMTNDVVSLHDPLPFEFSLESLHTKVIPLLEVSNEGEIHEVESSLTTGDAFRGMGPFFALELEESLELLFKNIP
jgi:hypothetical protein